MLRIQRTIGWIFAAVGAAMLIAAAVLYQRDAHFAASARSAIGDVVELVPSSTRDSDGRTSHRHSSRIRFATVAGRTVEFVESVSTSPPRHSVGERVRILYDPANPSQAVVDDVWGRRGPLLFILGFALLFGTLGAIFVTAALRRTRRAARLRQEGRAVQAEFLHVFTDAGLNINGRRPFRVAAQATDPVTGKLRRFESDRIWVDPTSRLRGRTVTVLLDRDGDGYLVDLSNLIDADAYA